MCVGEKRGYVTVKSLVTTTTYEAWVLFSKDFCL